MISFQEAVLLKRVGYPQEPFYEDLVYYVDLRDGSQRICRFCDLPKESSINMVYVIPSEHELVKFISRAKINQINSRSSQTETPQKERVIKI